MADGIEKRLSAIEDLMSGREQSTRKFVRADDPDRDALIAEARASGATVVRLRPIPDHGNYCALIVR